MTDDYTLRNAREYETGVSEYEAYNADRSIITPYLDALCDRLPEGARVLDLGCGPGWETRTLHDRGFTAVGFDLSRAFLRHARSAHSAAAPYVRGDMRRLPFASDSFAGVWACASLLHLSTPDLQLALSEVARVLTPEGAVVASIQVGDREGFVPRKSAPGTELFYGYRSPEDWRARLEAAGFSIDDQITELSEAEERFLNEGSRGWSTAIAHKAA